MWIGHRIIQNYVLIGCIAQYQRPNIRRFAFLRVQLIFLKCLVGSFVNLTYFRGYFSCGLRIKWIKWGNKTVIYCTNRWFLVKYSWFLFFPYWASLIITNQHRIFLVIFIICDDCCAYSGIPKPFFFFLLRMCVNLQLYSFCVIHLYKIVWTTM